MFKKLCILALSLIMFSSISLSTSFANISKTKAYSTDSSASQFSFQKNLNKNISTGQASEIISSSQYFTENKGQWHPSIKYMGNTPFGRVAFTTNEICYEMKQTKDESDSAVSTEFNKSVIPSEYITLSFVNSVTPTLSGTKPLIHKNNYLFGPQESWAIGCNNYQTVTYTNVWNGIDLAYTFTKEGLKYEYYVSPEANLNDLQIKVAGANIKENEKTLVLETLNQSSSLQDNTNNLKTTITLLDDKLYTYTKESKQELESSFVINDENIYSFKVENLPKVREETIVIDPVVYSTYIGGTSFELANSIKIDQYGNAYITGQTNSSETENFPICQTIPGAYKVYSGDTDAFVMKLSADGSTLLYSTYIGGILYERGYSLALDDECNVYLAGDTQSAEVLGFPICPSIPGPYKNFGGDTDAFVMKLSADGSTLLYSTYIGGMRREIIYSVSVDGDGNAYFTGTTYSSELDGFPICPSIPGPYKNFGGGADAFVMKLSADGSNLLYASYVGGLNYDASQALVIDEDRNVYITGSTSSSEAMDFPICPSIPGPYKNFSGSHDAYVLKLSADGTTLLFSTYIGGENWELGASIAIDESNNVYITGQTDSTENQGFPICPSIPGPYKVFGGDSDIYAIKIAADGSQLLYSTYLGGELKESSYAITVDTYNNAYIAGYTSSSENQGFPICPSIPGSYKRYSGEKDTCLLKLSNDGSRLLYSTYIGGTEYDVPTSVVADSLGNVFVAGRTLSSENQGFPICPFIPGPYKVFGGVSDAFVMKLSTCPPPTLLNPVDFALNVVVAPTFKWEEIYCPCTHDLEILKKNVRVDIYTGITNKEFNTPAGSLSYETEYQWRVRGKGRIWSQLFTFTTLSSPPNLNISAASNGKIFNTGDDVVYKINITNLGQTKDTNLKVSVTFPTTITYQSSTLGRGNVLPSGELILNINQIEGNETTTFNITGAVTTSISNATSATTVFKLTSELSQSSQTHVTIILKRIQSGVDRLNAKLRLEGLVYDSQTGKYYLPVGDKLTTYIELTGFSTPFSYKLYWGDGQTKEEANQTNTEWSNTHTYKDKGTMTLKLVIQDSNGRSKTVSVNVEVK
ncbi:MAG: SBBP repeat-containing protein [Caldisericia bacterium]|nr:SBBP repeat-containing protein [Caldisericia bacterium]